METKHLKKYAPAARRDFIAAVMNKAALYGLLPNEILPMQEAGDVVIIGDRPFPRTVAKQRKELEAIINKDGYEQFIEAIAYTWFNRFIAIRYMELHGYLNHGYRVLSHPNDGNVPEVMEYAERLELPGLDQDVVIDLKLDGQKDDELYRMILIAQCNALHDIMPFMFEKVSDASELLLPDNLLHTESLVRALVQEVPASSFDDIEAVGWLYQFYISEKKDDVFAALKKGKKITPENIPAATQLFTPHWIVRYLVENSLGRLWMLNHPDSRLAEQMDYYIRPEASESDGEPPCWRPEWRAQFCNVDGTWRGSMWLRPDRSSLFDWDRAMWYALSIDGYAYAKERWSSDSGPDHLQDKWQSGDFSDSTFEDLRAHLFHLQRSRRESSPANEPTEPFWACYKAVCDAWDREWRDHQAELPTPPNQSEPRDFLRISRPEEIKICDPACGSGHMLTYAFDLLYAIYEEQGYKATDIPRLILTHNLYGVEIDRRAGALATFALTMKAREKYRRFLSSSNVVQPNICVLENVAFESDELENYFAAPFVGEGSLRDYFGETIKSWISEGKLEGYRDRLVIHDVACDLMEHLQSLELLRNELDEISWGEKRQKELDEHFDSGKKWEELNPTDQRAVASNVFWSLADKGELLGYADEIKAYRLIERLFTSLLRQWEEADNFGSLIRPLVPDVIEVLELLRASSVGEDLFLAGVHEKVLKTLRQVDYLSPKYHVVVTNPPYMGSNGMNASIRAYAKKHFPENKSDLFAIMTERFLNLTRHAGFSGLMTPFVWMFIGSFEHLRRLISQENTLTCLVLPEYHAFFDSAYVPICAFVVEKSSTKDEATAFIDLSKFYGQDRQPVMTLEAIRRGGDCEWFFKVKGEEFQAIPGAPLAFTASENLRDSFKRGIPLGKIGTPKKGMATGDNQRFIRKWYEVALDRTSIRERKKRNAKWFPYNTGGEYRKWYGNVEDVVDWENDGEAIKGFVDENGRQRSRPQNVDHSFKATISWTSLSSTFLGVRYYPDIFVNDQNGNFIVIEASDIPFVLSFLCTPIAVRLINLLNPTMHILVGNIRDLPVIDTPVLRDQTRQLAGEAISLARSDWDSRETSWDFSKLGLLASQNYCLEERYDGLREQAANDVKRLSEIEKQNNELFIESYALTGELSPVPTVEELTLSCNPRYRYGSDKNESELEALLLADTMREFISYSVGCMLGRYSLDKPGLILANQGETLADYVRIVGSERWAMGGEESHADLPTADSPPLTFMPDEDNVIPLSDDDWFSDDISKRFSEFLQVTFGSEHYAENLKFLEDALYPDNLTGKKRKTIRDYFLKEFYNHHIKLYKKRPIYWLFSSGKQGAFKALIYMHRYTPSTLSRMRTEYVTKLHGKFNARIDQLESDIPAAASTSQRKKLEKERDKFIKQRDELQTFDEKLRHYADQRIEIDLDDGVKFNYGKFGDLLAEVKAITGEKPKVEVLS